MVIYGMPETKVCSKCTRNLPLDKFCAKNRGKFGRESYCRECGAGASREWYSRNKDRVAVRTKEYNKRNRERIRGIANKYHKKFPDKRPKWARTAYIKREYGIKDEQYKQLLQSQYGICAICCLLSPNGHFDIDHCHKSGKIRGLLCRKCNTGIGLLGENVENLTRAIEYIKWHRENG